MLLAGWLVLGQLGHRLLPQAAGGLAATALWLAASGTALAWASGRRVTVPALRLALLVLAAAAAAGAWLLGRQPLPGLLLLAIAWAGLLVAASCAVRCLRQALCPPLNPSLNPAPDQPPPPPVLAALGGALLAVLAAAGPAAALANPVTLAVALGAAGVLLAALLQQQTTPVTVCRAGLFDCALALAPLRNWSQPAAWPTAAAGWAMLPMMAMLASMADWCASSGLDARSATALHLGAMLLPALRVWWLTRQPAGRPQTGGPVATPGTPVGGTATATTCGLLLAAGGAVLWWPGAAGLGGLMAASLLQGLAWGVAWTARWAVPRPTLPGLRTALPGSSAAAAVGAALPALLAALLVLALGSAVMAHGPAALRWVHGLLALLGGAGVLLHTLQRLALQRVKPGGCRLAGRAPRPTRRPALGHRQADPDPPASSAHSVRWAPGGPCGRTACAGPRWAGRSGS